MAEDLLNLDRDWVDSVRTHFVCETDGATHESSQSSVAHHCNAEHRTSALTPTR